MTDSTGLALTRLTLTNFRNYSGLRLDVSARLIALSGPNGAGKTNLLEAISLLTPGRGLRGASFDELANLQNASSWAIAAEVATPNHEVKLGTGWSVAAGEADGASAGRLVLIDGHLQKGSGALGEYMRMLWLTPAMDRLFAGPAGDRRRFLDRLVATFDPEHSSRVAVFEKVMRERNLLLQEPRADAVWLGSLEAHMAEASVAIAAARMAAVEALQKHIHETRQPAPSPGGKSASMARSKPWFPPCRRCAPRTNIVGCWLIRASPTGLPAGPSKAPTGVISSSSTDPNPCPPRNAPPASKKPC